jgi:hypothetical protein
MILEKVEITPELLADKTVDIETLVRRCIELNMQWHAAAEAEEEERIIVDGDPNAPGSSKPCGVLKA